MVEKISKILGVKIDSCIEISTNQVATVYNCDNRFLVKQSSNFKLIVSEAKMLKYLKKHTKLKIPKVYYNDNNLLITEYIANNGICNSDCEKEIARNLATLHLVKSKKFGFEEDTTIGPFIQPNGWSDSWIEFYQKMRVEYFAKKALEEGSLPIDIYRRLMGLNNYLDNFLIEPKEACLIHGDIWAGNVLTNNNKVAAFIDPAIYYAHNEVELAFIAMFNTFGKTFYSEYSKIIPIEDGFFERRLSLYQIYPILVHILIYGKSYIQSLEDILIRYKY